LPLSEEPYGIFYTDIEPTAGFALTVGQPLSLELERQGKVPPGLEIGGRPLPASYPTPQAVRHNLLRTHAYAAIWRKALRDYS